MQKENAYLEEVVATLPRLLALYDRDETSPSSGMGDRFYWAWKLIDFGNATFQGAANGLARLVGAGLLPDWLAPEAVQDLIDAIFSGADRLRYPNGSVEEAFPYESSFCVTALVAYDLLSAIESLQGQLEAEKMNRYLDIVRPMIRFLLRSDEKHAVIANHLATAVAALEKWHQLTGEETRTRAHFFLKRILQEQSSEGWYREYEGADPGYQSLCTYYLADVYRMTQDPDLFDSLERSLRFLWYFAHPDGSFGGIYGSRNTRFYFPAGIEFLAERIPEAQALADHMVSAISDRRVVTLACMDEANLIPMFNAYCWAAQLKQSRGSTPFEKNSATVPSKSAESWQKVFNQAGLLINNTRDSYTIVSWHKGGVCYHFDKRGSQGKIDAGAVYEDEKGKRYHTQAYDPQNVLESSPGRITVTSRLVLLQKKLPTPYQFVILRLLNITAMRSQILGNLLKKAMVKYLITARKQTKMSNIREIDLSAGCTIRDRAEGSGGKRLKQIALRRPFIAIHMASQGYWQKQDTRT